MPCSTPKRVRVSALVSLCVFLAASPLLAETTLTFSGEITEVLLTPPYPFEQVGAGDPWTLTYTFGPVDDIDPSSTAGQYVGAVTGLTLTIGTEEVSGAPGVAIANGNSSVIGVNLDSGYADYTVMVGVPDASAWAQVALWDVDGTPFTSDVLPLEIPTPYEDFFPDGRNFSLRLPGSTALYLAGVVGLAAPVVEVGTHKELLDNGGRYRDMVHLQMSETVAT